MAMYGWKWADGVWRDSPEPREPQVGAHPRLSPRKPWVKRGFFRDYRPMSRREVMLKASNARDWLEYVLHSGPKPATEVLRLARLEGIPEGSLRRAKYHHKVKSLKRGGRQHGYGAVWYWQYPVSN